jgi:hypothetical protein
MILTWRLRHIFFSERMFFPTVNALADEQGQVAGDALPLSYEAEVQRDLPASVLVIFVGPGLQND